MSNKGEDICLLEMHNVYTHSHTREDADEYEKAKWKILYFNSNGRLERVISKREIESIFFSTFLIYLKLNFYFIF